MQKVKQTTFPFKIGADPEFLLFYGDKHIDAGRTIPKFFDGKFPKGEAGFKVGTAGEFGWDGHSSTGEIRPSANANINILTDNIGALFAAAHKTMPLFEMSTLSIGRPIGGHIHLDAPDNFIGNERLMLKIKKIISIFLIPITASEHKLSSTQRTKGSGYGALTDIRVSRENSRQTYEIRGPSSEWMISPKICRATLAYVGVIWNEILKNHATMGKNEIIFKSIPQAKAMQDMIISNYKPLTKMITGMIAKEIKKFELYPQFKEEIDFILNPQIVSKEKEAAGWNINTGWSLNRSTVTKRNLNATKSIAQKVKSIDIELLTDTFMISYNDDYNVAIFASGISERIATLNWNLSHEYFLFGLKKETQGFIAAPAIQFTNEDGAPLCYTIPDNIPKENSVQILKNIARRVTQTTGSAVKINPKTGKAFAGVSNTILIGIPYDVRADKNLKPLMNLIWDIEQKKLKAQDISVFTTKNISHKEPTPTAEAIITGTAQGGLLDEVQIIAQEAIAEDYQTVETLPYVDIQPPPPQTETESDDDMEDNDDNE